MKFSQRIGKTPINKELQLSSIDEDLLNSLWNAFILGILEPISKQSGFYSNRFDYLSEIIWINYFKLPMDRTPGTQHFESTIRKYFFGFKWFEVYDFIEFIANINTERIRINTEEYKNYCNHILEREFSAYRFVDGIISPISNTIEVEEIEQAIEKINYFTSLKGANIHLTNALNKLSDRKYPDYRNSIKESISAIETTCRVLTEENTLGKALNALETKGIIIDGQLKSGFEKIYASTNNRQSGIRHAIVEDHKEPDFEDAKFMLVASSSFINYLVGKCEKQKIIIK